MVVVECPQISVIASNQAYCLSSIHSTSTPNRDHSVMLTLYKRTFSTSNFLIGWVGGDVTKNDTLDLTSKTNIAHALYKRQVSTTSVGNDQRIRYVILRTELSNFEKSSRAVSDRYRECPICMCQKVWHFPLLFRRCVLICKLI